MSRFQVLYDEATWRH